MQREPEHAGRTWDSWAHTFGTYLFRFVHPKTSSPEQNQAGDQMMEEVDCRGLSLDFHKRGILSEAREPPAPQQP